MNITLDAFEFYNEPAGKLYLGHVLNVLEAMPDESVQTVVTSPPYWGLRDYGTGTWTGGDPECKHVLKKCSQNLDKSAASKPGCAQKASDIPGRQFNGTCKKCGAVREDKQLGLEATPAEYIENMVEVLAQIWRVLRTDGTVWLNLGSSYASGDMNASQSPLLWRAPACDSDDKEPQDCQHADHACPDSDDECQDETQSHRAHSVRNDQAAQLSEPLLSRIDHDSEHLDCEKASPDVFVCGAQPSNTRASFRRDRAACVPVTKASVSPRAASTSFGGELQSSHKSDDIDDIASTLLPLIVRKSGKESFFSACNSPSCQGIGRCGRCWCNLAIPSLNIKRKDEINMPHLVAMALQADGWILRQTIIWHKRNPMPESVQDRPTKAHEYVFLLVKSGEPQFWVHRDRPYTEREYTEPAPDWHWKNQITGEETAEEPADWETITYTADEADAYWKENHDSAGARPFAIERERAFDYDSKQNAMKEADGNETEKPKRLWKRRNLWRGCDYYYDHAAIAEPCVTPLQEKVVPSGWDTGPGGHDDKVGRYDRRKDFTHFATFPPELVKTCILAGAPEGGIVLDPFMGSGTVAEAARDLNRNFLGIDLKEEYLELARKRLQQMRLAI
jgi:DNA modification methylase